MKNISDVFIINARELIENRETKHVVCVSVSAGMYLLINTEHRKIYDDLEIKASDYEFLGSINRFVECSELFRIEQKFFIKKVGSLYREDMIKITEKIRKSKFLTAAEKKTVLPELEKWLLI